MNRVILKTNQNHPQIIAYKKALEKGMQGHHVIPRGDEWVVKRAGADRVTGVFSTQSEAISKAKILAQNNNSELFIHGKDGRIRERI